MTVREEAQRKVDGEFVKLAEREQWRKCRCGVMIERIEGCNHMTCDRCSWEMCYRCGREWREDGEGGEVCDIERCVDDSSDSDDDDDSEDEDESSDSDRDSDSEDSEDGDGDGGGVMREV